MSDGDDRSREDLAVLLADLPLTDAAFVGAPSSCGRQQVRTADRVGSELSSGRVRTTSASSDIPTSNQMSDLLDDGDDEVCTRFFQALAMQGTDTLRSIVHVNCRGRTYPGSDTARVKLSDHELPWSFKFEEGAYKPHEFTALSVLKRPVWADPSDVRDVIFNQFDPIHGVDRTSHEGPYLVDEVHNWPLNPRGRTGLCGRGVLGRFGPNHAADPVVSRWVREEGGKIVYDARGQPQLEFVAIKRKDTGEWAIPGGMVDPGENISATLKREFGEETLATLEMPEDKLESIKHDLDTVFQNGTLIYSGYVDDHRNTDNAWMETMCVNFHDETGRATRCFRLAAGDDAGDVAWTRYYEGMPLYATHTIFLSLINKMRLAWRRRSGAS